MTEDFSVLNSNRMEAEEDSLLYEKEENMKTLIDECKKMLITEPEACLGGWGLIDCDPTYVCFTILCHLVIHLFRV